MTEIFLLLLGTVLVNNFVLVQFLGLCPFMGVSGKLETAMGMSMATTFVLTIASMSSYLVESYVLLPLGIELMTGSWNIAKREELFFHPTHTSHIPMVSWIGAQSSFRKAGLEVP